MPVASVLSFDPLNVVRQLAHVIFAILGIILFVSLDLHTDRCFVISDPKDVWAGSELFLWPGRFQTEVLA